MLLFSLIFVFFFFFFFYKKPYKQDSFDFSNDLFLSLIKRACIDNNKHSFSKTENIFLENIFFVVRCFLLKVFFL